MVQGRVLVGLCLLWGCSDDANEPSSPSSQLEPSADAGRVPLDAASEDALADAAGRADGSSASDASRVRDAGAVDAGAPYTADAANADAGTDAGAPASCVVGPVPERVRSTLALDAFYVKYADADGLAVLGSDAPDDRALISACQLVRGMLAKRDDVRKALIAAKARFAIIGKDEGTADIPEYGYGQRSQAERDQINQRARGLGGLVASCGEENISCLAGDRYWNESICVHEFSHTISSYGVYRADRSFEQRLGASYQAALDAGILEGTYRRESVQEYWAEGVQDWYDTNASANPPNGIHNQVNTRGELKDYDPTLYGLIAEVFPSELDWEDCHAP